MKRKFKAFFLSSVLLLTGCQEPGIIDDVPTDNPGEDEEKPTPEPPVDEFDAKEFLLESLHGELALEFNLTKSQINATTQEESNFVDSKMKTFIGENEFWNYEEQDGVILNEAHYFKNAEGKAVTRKPNITNTELLEETMMDYETYEDQIFDDKYASPFKDIKEDSFKITDNRFEVDLTKFDTEYLQTLFTVYSGEVTALVFTVDEEKEAVNFAFVAQYDVGYGDILVNYEASGTLTSKEELGVRAIALLDKTEDHAVVDEKIELLKKQNHEFTYTLIDPDTDKVSEIYEVGVTKDMVLISHTEDDVTSEYGFMNTDKGLVSFDVRKENDKVYFDATGKAVEGQKVEDKLIDFTMASAFFTKDENVWKLHLGQGFGEYLNNFLPSALIEDNASSIDEETFKMEIDDDKMTIDYDYSYGLWHVNLVVDNFENAANPYPNYEFVEFTNPTSWSETDFYNDLVALLGNEERVNELPFIYPDLGYTSDIIIPDFDMGTLIGEFSSAELASDTQFDYTMDLMMAGFMMNMEDMNVYEKEYPEYTLQVETKVDKTKFTLYLTLVRPQ